MFTGIITHLAKIESIEKDPQKDAVLHISLPAKSIDRKLKIGCSIAFNGICLTLIEQKIIENKSFLGFEVSKETCDKTTFNRWKVSQFVNLEFSLRAQDELGGHFVLGHVDCVGELARIETIEGSKKFDFYAPANMKKFIAQKGSITINGTSLTINSVDFSNADKPGFSINLISHTIKQTSFQFLKIGDLVNLEADLMARILWQQKEIYQM